MIKGVNKKIIEINNPESIYFEKAVFYLRPEVIELPQQVAEEEIERYIARLGILSQHRKNSNLRLILTLFCFTAILLSVIIFCVM